MYLKKCVLKNDVLKKLCVKKWCVLFNISPLQTRIARHRVKIQTYRQNHFMN